MNIRIINYKKKFHRLVGSKAFSEWLGFDSFYGGKMLHFNIKHYTLEVDFRVSNKE